MTILLVSFITFTAYIVYVVAKYGIPRSVSDSYYLLGRCGYVFTGWCWAVALSVAAVMFEQSEGCGYQFLGLFAGGGLAFVGAAPLFRSHEKIIHYCSAGVCALAALVWMAAAGWWYVPAAFLTVAGCVAWRFGKVVFWIELGLFCAMYATIGIEMI
jgi:hypothetical protein